MEVKISAVILTLNEEKNIERCITSVIGVADDVVVVDSFSTDKTEEICLALGVRFVKHKFEGYIEQKNWALTQAIHPIVLSLDADEALSDELRASVLEVKHNWAATGYSFNRLTSYCGKWIHHCGWYPDTKLRLWEVGKGVWGGSNPHDKVVMQEGTTTKWLRGDLLHYSYTSIRQHINQINHFTTIKAKAKLQKGEKGTIMLILFSPVVKMFKQYLLKKGFLDGYYGFVISVISSLGQFLTYVKLREMNQGKEL